MLKAFIVLGKSFKGFESHRFGIANFSCSHADNEATMLRVQVIMGRYGVEVSWNGGTPKSSMSRWNFPFYPVLNHQFWGILISWNRCILLLSPIFTFLLSVAVREEDGLQNEAVEDALHNCSSSSNQTYQDSRHIHDISRQPVPQWQFIPCLP